MTKSKSEEALERMYHYIYFSCPGEWLEGAICHECCETQSKYGVQWACEACPFESHVDKYPHLKEVNIGMERPL